MHPAYQVLFQSFNLDKKLVSEIALSTCYNMQGKKAKL